MKPIDISNLCPASFAFDNDNRYTRGCTVLSSDPTTGIITFDFTGKSLPTTMAGIAFHVDSLAKETVKILLSVDKESEISNVTLEAKRKGNSIKFFEEELTLSKGSTFSKVLVLPDDVTEICICTWINENIGNKGELYFKLEV